MEGETLRGPPTRELRKAVFHGKAQGHLQRGEANPGGTGLRGKFLAEKNVGKHPFPVPVGVAIDEVPEVLGLEATAAVAHAIGAGFQSTRLPRGPDIVVAEKGRIPEVEVDRETVGLDVHQERGGKILIQFQGLKTLALGHIGGRHLSPFAGMDEGRLPCGEMDDRAEINTGADVVQDPGRKIGVLFRVVDQEGDLGEVDFYCGGACGDFPPEKT